MRRGGALPRYAWRVRSLRGLAFDVVLSTLDVVLRRRALDAMLNARLNVMTNVMPQRLA